MIARVEFHSQGATEIVLMVTYRNYISAACYHWDQDI